VISEFKKGYKQKSFDIFKIMPFLVLLSLFVLLSMTVFNWSKNKNIIFITLLLTSINLWAILHYWLVIDFNASMAAIFDLN